MNISSPLPNKQITLLTLAAGIFSAALLGIASLSQEFGLLVLFSYFSPLPLFLIGLATNRPLDSLAAGSLAALIVGVLLGWHNGLVFFVAQTLPIAGLLYYALKREQNFWYPAGYLLAISALIGLALFFIGLLFSLTLSDGLHSLIVGMLTQMVGQIPETQLPPEAREQMLAIIPSAALMIPAMLIYSWELLLLFNAWLALKLGRRFNLNTRPELVTDSFFIPFWPMALMTASGALAFLLSTELKLIAFTVAAIAAMVPYTLGLVTLHLMVRGWYKFGKYLLLTTVYVLLLAEPRVAVLIVILGVCDHFLNLRQRFAISPKNGV